MKIDIKKMSSKKIIEILFEKLGRNWIMLDNKYKLGVGSRIFVADNDTKKVVALNRKNVIEFLEKNNFNTKIDI